MLTESTLLYLWWKLCMALNKWVIIVAPACMPASDSAMLAFEWPRDTTMPFSVRGIQENPGVGWVGGWLRHLQ